MAPTSVGGPLPTHSRVGREQQRYGIDGERLVAGWVLCPGLHNQIWGAGSHPQINKGSSIQQPRQVLTEDHAACRCIPVRVSSAGCGPETVSILLITSRGGKGFVFPKV